jgi:osomolarity two-component system, sensor histidine kinase SLN1
MPTLRSLVEKSRNSSNAGMPTPATSTAVDDSLPIPVLARTTSFSNPKRKSARFGGFTVYLAKLKRRIGTGTAPSSSSVVGDSAAESSYTRRMEARSEGEEVDEVVVDRVWSDDIKSSISHSEYGPTPEKAGSTSHPIGPSVSDHDSLRHEGFWNLSSHLVILRWRVWPVIVKFFSSSFADEKSEEHYAQVWKTLCNLFK